MTLKREGVDMSARAVANRLEDVRQLYKLGMPLLEAGRTAGLNSGLRRHQDER